MNFKKLIDITIPIQNNMASYPKNPEVKIDSMSTGSSTISSLHLGSHTGTHVDAPAHVFEGAQTVDNIPLSALVGPCRVLDMTHCPESVGVVDLEKYNIQPNERILLKTTNSQRGYNEFYSDYVFLHGDAADYLAALNVSLVGIDYLSIKQRGSDDHRPHTSLLEKEIIIFEGLNLKDVDEGSYFLMALPLKLKDLDGAPARVVLGLL